MADNNDDVQVPDEDENAQPDEKQQEKDKKVAPDDQLKKAIDVLKNPAQQKAA